MRDVAGKVAFITGGASGIGLGMARVFLRNGMKVVIADLLQEHLDEAATLLAGAGDFHLIRADVSDRAAMARAAAETLRVFAKVHVLCNNAGVSTPVALDVAGYSEWDYVLGVNLGGTVNGLVNFLPGMKAHGEGGHVINTSSMAGMIPVPAFAGIYATSKFAIRGLSDALRLALGPHRIGVSVLCPGFTRTRALTGGQKYRIAHDGADAPPPPPPPPRDPSRAGLAEAGMDPVEVGEHVLHAILHNELYIFPHGEFREEVRGYFNDMLAAFPDPEQQQIDPVRREAEARRARMTAEAKAVADRINTQDQ